MTGRPLDSLLHARSVAIVGISGPGKFGGQIYANLKTLGYPGAIFGVNPNYQTLYDQPCYPSLRSLPEIPECAILGVSNTRLLSTLTDAAETGIPSAVIFSNALGIQDHLAEVARSHNLTLCGPNCMGFIAFGQRLAASGYRVLAAPPGNVALITHSGSVFDALVQNKRGVYFNYAISPGNEMMTGLADYLSFVIDQPSTDVVALFLETVRDPQGFLAALAEAAERDIPIVALKVGRTRQSAQFAQAHSGALAGDDAVFDAVCARYGVRRVKSLDEMLDTLELFATKMRPTTRHTAAIFDSGGERSLFVDLADSEGVTLAVIGEPTRARLAASLEPGLEPVNPLDAWGTLNNFGQTYAECLKALDADPDTGLTLFAVDLSQAGNLGTGYGDLALRVRPELTKPLAFLTHVGDSINEVEAGLLRRAGVPVLMGTETGLRAVKHVLEYSHYQRTKEALDRNEVIRYPERVMVKLEGDLDEFASHKILKAYGIPIPTEEIVTCLAEALQAAECVGYPVVLKTATGAQHKTEQGGVHLNLGNPNELAAAFHDLDARLGPRMLVQQMIAGGVEVLLGILNDSQFGLMLVVGMGGVFLEVYKDRQLVMLPASRGSIKEALLGLRGAARFKGWRSQPPVDLNAVVDCALRLSALALDLGDQIAAIDINPLIALPHRVVAVDALIFARPQNPIAQSPVL